MEEDKKKLKIMSMKDPHLIEDTDDETDESSEIDFPTDAVAPPKNVIKEDGNIYVRNPMAYWIPEIKLEEEINGTIYCVTCSYKGNESFLRKLERFAERKNPEEVLHFLSRAKEELGIHCIDNGVCG